MNTTLTSHSALPLFRAAVMALALSTAVDAAKAEDLPDLTDPLVVPGDPAPDRPEQTGRGRRRSIVQQLVAGLQGASLTTGSLQPSSGLQSSARGLTPADEWRRAFPVRQANKR